MPGTCRDCKFLDVGPDRLGRRVPRKNKGYRCTAPVPEINWPMSVTEHLFFNYPPRRMLMTPEDGEGCPTHESTSNS